MSEYKDIEARMQRIRADVRTDGDTGRPDFAGFAKHLREEARWSARIHGQDSIGDQEALNRLADSVERVGRRLGYM